MVQADQQMPHRPSRRAERADQPIELESNDGMFAIDFRRIIGLIRREAVWITAITVAAVALGVVVTLLTTPMYTARSSVLVEQQADQIVEGGELTPAASYQDADRFLQTQVDVFNSRTLAARVVQARRLSENPAFFEAVGKKLPETEDLPSPGKSEKALADYRIEQAILHLQENLSITLPRESRVISIGFKSANPALSAQIANTFSEQYIAGNLNRKFESSSYARDFLTQQLQEARTKLEESERELNLYSRAAGLIRIAGQGANADRETTLSVTNESLVQANSSANLAAAERAAAEDRWQAIANVPVLSMPQALANPAMQAMIKQQADVNAELAAAKARYRDDYPAVLALTTQSNRIEKQIEMLGGGIKRSVYLDYKAALEKEKTLKSEVATLKGAALTEQDRGVQYNVLKRVAETNRSSYDALLERYNQLNASAGATANNVSIVDNADIPSDPSSPDLLKNLAIAAILGLGLAAVVVVVRDHFDDTVRSPLDVEAKLGVPLLGLIPRTETDGEDALTQVKTDPKLPISEAYVSLVTNLNYSTSNGAPRSVAVTSSQASEGKSTTANAIALNFARLGKSVLLIDADMRRPTLHRIQSMKLTAGLSDILSGHATLSDVSFSDIAHGNLSMVLAGTRPPEPSLLLGGGRLAALIAECEVLADVVIIDCPPLLGLSDTASIAAHVEAVLLVVDSSQGHRGAVKSSIRRLALVGGHVLGAVLTKFDPKSAGSEYSHYGYNYYSYGKDE